MDVEKLESKFETASQALKRSGGGSGSDPLTKRRGVEANYYAAYRALVKAGLRPPIRSKYRGA